MVAQYVSSTLWKSLTTKGGKDIAVHIVDRTTQWARPPGLLSQDIMDDFVQVVQDNVDKFKSTTTKVAMKESAHKSDNDRRVHFTVFGLNDQDEVVETHHLTRKMEETK